MDELKLVYIPYSTLHFSVHSGKRTKKCDGRSQHHRWNERPVSLTYLQKWEEKWLGHSISRPKPIVIVSFYFLFLLFLLILIMNFRFSSSNTKNTDFIIRQRGFEFHLCTYKLCDLTQTVWQYLCLFSSRVNINSKFCLIILPGFNEIA